MKKLILYFILITQSIFGQSIYSIKNIADSLKLKIDAVIRHDNSEIIIENIGSYIYKRNWAVSVFNETGEAEFATLQINYDKFSKIKKIEGTIFDAEGKELKKLKGSEIKDISLGINGDEVTDNRVKLAEFDKKYYPYPYTVEFSYELHSTNMLFLPSWTPIEYENISVEKANFSINCPLNINYQKKQIGKLGNPKITEAENQKTEFWSLENFKFKESEPYVFENQAPTVIVAPVEFSIDGFTGNGKSWSNLSSFYHNLNKNRDKLPQKTIDEVLQITKDEKGIEQKIKKVYEYVQSHTRYQSIQLGIGGWQTRPAWEVAEKGYGDCKALTNYTISLLKQIDVTAYPALIKAGSDAKLQNTEVPRMAFNHVIACVPMPKDTIWLECTSQDNPFGYIGDFTGNRKALIIKPENGELVNTSKYLPENNLLVRKAEVSIQENGDTKIILNNFYSGIQQDFRYSLYKTKSPSEIKDWLINRYQLPNIQIVNNSFSTKNLKIPELTESMQINCSKLGAVTGKRMFIKPNLFTINTEPPAPDSLRENKLFLNPNSESYLDIDSIAFKLPENYKIETLPKDFSIKNSFGEYNVSIKIADEASLVYYRKLKFTGGFYSKEKYAELVDFYKKIKINDRQKIVLVKKET